MPGRLEPKRVGRPALLKGHAKPGILQVRFKAEELEKISAGQSQHTGYIREDTEHLTCQN
jgi:hypothetical protein